MAMIFVDIESGMASQFKFAETRSSRVAAGGADAVHMAVVGAAAAAKHIDMRETPGEIGILPAELERIADVKLWRIVELGVAQPR